MKSLSFKNFRSLKDIDEIQLSPITILVGKNSSGKSTLIRSFPLLKQTVVTRKNEPILWYDKDFVDFGSFKESLNSNIVYDEGSILSTEGIEIGFKFNIRNTTYSRPRFPYKETAKKDILSRDIQVKIEVYEKYIKKCVFIIGDYSIQFDLIEVCDEKNNNIYSH